MIYLTIAKARAGLEKSMRINPDALLAYGPQFGSKDGSDTVIGSWIIVGGQSGTIQVEETPEQIDEALSAV